MDFLHGRSARKGQFEERTKISSCRGKEMLKTFDKNGIREFKSLKAKNVATGNLRPEMIAARREETFRGGEFGRVCSHMTVTAPSNRGVFSFQVLFNPQQPIRT
jgi:hypothetical protein